MSFGVMDGLRRRNGACRVPRRRGPRGRFDGRRDKAFCAGADLGGGGIGSSGVEAHEGRGLLADLFPRDVGTSGNRSIARVRGYALAGGFGLACACDMIVAADDAVSGRRRSTSASGRT
jgi:1,4-dihydroxy-2-naphthoyl-CoA synthase